MAYNCFADRSSAKFAQRSYNLWYKCQFIHECFDINLADDELDSILVDDNLSVIIGEVC